MKDASISTNTILTTKRLILRYPKLNDAAEIFSVVKSPQFPEQLPLKEWNKGSMRVLEKIGMKYTGDNPKGYYSKGEPIATREFEISRVR